uniref:Uncharacterized protein n=1 Tax=Rhizophora mucronata TaxID=61149 RepID=A0A2P2JEP6_RHIMU
MNLGCKKMKICGMNIQFKDCLFRQMSSWF